MKIDLAPVYEHDPQCQDAKSILEACVHCGFCIATCPTYLALGDERDGPRGRIYMMKSVLEGHSVSTETRDHLDRCLTCRSCETTCPSGVRYSHLLEVGRNLVEARVPRSAYQRLHRWLLRQVLPYRKRVGPLLRLGQLVRPLLPRQIKQLILPTSAKLPIPKQLHQRIMLSMPGCVQQGLAPNTDRAAARVLDRLGIQLVPVVESGCCGAIDLHLNAHDVGLAKARANIDAVWPYIEAGAEAIVMTASGCGATVQDYGYLLRHDDAYREKAKSVVSLTKDLVEVLADEDLSKLVTPVSNQRIAVHCPCTQQHAMKLQGRVKELLAQQGLDLVETQNDHLCCGSAGTYSIYQADLSQQLKRNKLRDLSIATPDMIVTANIGCQMHLTTTNSAKETQGVPVKHWIELFDDLT